MSDKRSNTSADNGKKGGRPVSEATIRAQEARNFISEQVKNNLGAIVSKAIVQAIEGDYKAREWLSGYSWGKPAINLGTDEDGQPIKILFDNAFTSETTDDSKK